MFSGSQVIIITILFSISLVLNGIHTCSLCAADGTAVSPMGATEGCKGFAQPPIPYHPNLHANSTLTFIPDSYLSRMKQLVSQVSEMIINDYPPQYESKFTPFVYWGTAGRASMSLRLFRDTGNTTWLYRAKDYIDAALQTGPPPYHYDPLSFAFQKGRTGLISVAAVIYNELGDVQKTMEFLEEVNWIFDQVKLGDYFDWESGMAGLVYAAQFLNQYFDRPVIDSSKTIQILHLTFQSGLKYYNATIKALQYEKYKDHFWTGMGSHGSGSPIYALLQNEQIMKNETIRKYVLDTVDYYISIQTEKGQIPGDIIPDRTQWCHGIPGLLAPLALAYKLTNNETYLNAGILGSKLISEIGILTKGMQFCHGVGGNIYMLLDFYKQTGDKRVLSMAISMIMTSLDTPKLTDPNQWESYDCLPDGMFVSSSIGMVLLYSDIIRNADDLKNVQMVSFHPSI